MMWGWILLLTVQTPVADTLPLGAPLRSPARAVWLSALIPGGGQFYTHQVLKGVVLGVAELGTAYQTLQSLQATWRALDRYHRTGSPEDRQAYLDVQQETLYWFFWWLTFWGYSLADAYVSAHLYRIEWQIQTIESHTVSMRVGVTRAF